MQDDNLRLDAISEMLALSSFGNGKNIIFSGLDLKGPMDLPAFHEASRQSATAFPHFVSTIREIKINGRYHLVREHSPDLPLPYGVQELKIRDTSASLLDNILYTLSPRLDRDWDLFQELPLEMYLIRVSEQHHVLATFIHHVAGDVGSLMEFGQLLMANYHELVTGQPPDWKHEPLPVSSSRKRPVEKKQAKGRSWLDSVGGTLSGFLKPPAMPLGNGVRGNDEQYQIKRVLSLKESNELTGTTGRACAALPDRLTAATHFAVDQWNRERGIGPGTLTTGMTVNMRGRYKDLDNPNNSALIFLRSLPHERRDPNEFCRLLATQRMKRFRTQSDSSYYQNLQRFNNTFRILPFHLRQRVVSFVMNKHQVSVAITPLGVLWPTLQNGRPTGETFLKKSGALDVTEVHGLGYKLASNTRLLLVVYAFRDQVNLILASSASLFTRQESEQFMDLIMENLLHSDL
jgi:hypothetical protein